ncbi:MAG: ATP-binding cassette domain-containing protein [Halioglobus sp.]
MIEIQSATIAYGSNVVLTGVNLKVGRGELCCINTGMLGGSSTLLKCMAGLVKPLKGRCLVNGTDINTIPEKQILQLVCYCYEAGGLVSLFSVYENIILPLVYHHSVDPASLRQRALDVAEALHIADCLDKQVHELNDVQKRLVNMARALVVGSRLLLLDEIQEGMSTDQCASLLSYLREQRDSSGLSVVMTTTAGDDTSFADRVFSVVDKKLREHQ